MTSEEYCELAMRMAPRVERLSDAYVVGALGAADEAGEVAGLIKKHVFHGHPLDTVKLLKEIGDVLWYLNLLAALCGQDLGDVMEMNIAKLSARYPEGFFSTERSMNRAPGDV